MRGPFEAFPKLITKSMILSKETLRDADRIWRLNLVNSLSGIKPANLIGTKSESGQCNLAVFSSVVHLGSNPAQLGFVLRPQGDVPRHTFENIENTGVYTINHIPESLIQRAHYTSAKFEREISEFEHLGIEEEYIEDFRAPFVKESSVKMGMRFSTAIPLPNGCSFVIGDIEIIHVADALVEDNGQIRLDKHQIVGISGLNSYYKLSHMDTFPYARVNDLPDFL